jgi:hypothetical protein
MMHLQISLMAQVTDCILMIRLSRTCLPLGINSFSLFYRELWLKFLTWTKEDNYLLAAGSPPGKDTDISDLGIVQGHAYSILDICDVDGVKLIQLRNPWGNKKEWKGPWSDNSKEWTERSRMIVYRRMEMRGLEANKIGENDGIFWMTLEDFMVNFNTLYVCQVFNETY